MQKTKPIYKPHRYSGRRLQEQPYQNGLNFSISPLLHQQLVLSILNYQSTQSQGEVSLSMEDFLSNLQSDSYCHYDDQEAEKLHQDRIKRAHSLQQINLQYGRKIQQSDMGRAQRTQRVSFSGEGTVKYYRKEDSASEIQNYEEFCFNPLDQNEQLYRFNL